MTDRFVGHCDNMCDIERKTLTGNVNSHKDQPFMFSEFRVKVGPV